MNHPARDYAGLPITAPPPLENDRASGDDALAHGERAFQFTGDTRAQSIEISLAQPGEDSVGRAPIGLALLRERSRHPIVKSTEALNMDPY